MSGCCDHPASSHMRVYSVMWERYYDDCQQCACNFLAADLAGEAL